MVKSSPRLWGEQCCKLAPRPRCHSTRDAVHLCSSVFLLPAHRPHSGVKIPNLNPASPAYPHQREAANYQGLLLSVPSPKPARAPAKHSGSPAKPVVTAGRNKGNCP